MFVDVIFSCLLVPNSKYTFIDIDNFSFSVISSSQSKVNSRSSYVSNTLLVKYIIPIVGDVTSILSTRIIQFVGTSRWIQSILNEEPLILVKIILLTPLLMLALEIVNSSQLYHLSLPG